MNKLQILDFYDDWCGACMSFMPILEEIEKETGVEVVRIKASDNIEKTNEYMVRGLPCIIIQ
jgi:thiol-disulfide isomerase/thioredoxin